MNKITFVLFAFVLSITITIATPRPTYAEGPLLGTVRCVLKTVLLQRCQPAQTPPNVTPAPEPTPPKGSGAEPSSPSTTNKPAQPSSPDASSGGTQVNPTPARSSSNVAQEGEIALPKETAEMAPAVKGAAALHASGASLTDADYMTFFNTYSRYATDAQPRQLSAAPLETSSEGWKILGVAWYWWVALGLLGVAIFTSIKSYALRKSSSLPDV
jgi:hypothetical protein